MTTLLCFVRNLFFFLKPNNREKKILNLKHLGWKHHKVSVELHATQGPLKLCFYYWKMLMNALKVSVELHATQGPLKLCFYYWKMLMNVLRALVNNPVKESFNGKRKKKNLMF